MKGRKEWKEEGMKERWRSRKKQGRDATVVKRKEERKEGSLKS